MAAEPQNISVQRASIISLSVSVLVLGLKAWAYYITRSQVILSDALESIVNVLGAGVAALIVYLSSKPADEDHPYGHGKLEYFSAAFEGGLVLFASIMIFSESAKALLEKEAIQQLDVGLYFVVAASFLNLFLGLYLKNIGEKHGSEALQSSALHVLSDLWTTGGAVVGLALVMTTGVAWLDPVAAMIMAIFLAHSGYQVIRRSMDGLLDSHDPESLRKLAITLEKFRRPGIINIHEVRMIRSGPFHHVDAHVVVPEFWNVAISHQQTYEYETLVFQNYHLSGEIAFHVDPCRKQYCKACDLQECPLRNEHFVKKIEFTPETLTELSPPGEEYAYDSVSTNL